VDDCKPLLSGFDLVSELASIGSGSHGEARIVHSGFMVPDQYKPEEYRRGGAVQVDP
jgi:SCY1-like protein 1